MSDARTVRLVGGPDDGRTMQVAPTVRVLVGANLAQSSEHGVLAHRYVEREPHFFVFAGEEWV